MELGLKGRVALVSGASQGLGRATAMAFAAEGADVALCARNRDTLDELSRAIQSQFGVRVYSEPVDMSGSGPIEQFVANVVDHLGRIDVCIANTGGPPAKSFLDTEDSDWDAAFDLNLRSAITLARAVLPGMKEQGWGRIVTISSISVRQPQPDLVLSNTIRAGVLGLIRSLSNEFGAFGITANNVGPGYTATNRLLSLAARKASLSNKTEKEIEDEWIKDIPAARLGRPDEVAAAVVWLASEKAAFITGQTILVDGGMYKGL